jgi:translation initiation factor 4A
MTADMAKNAKDLSHDPSRFLAIEENLAQITPIHVRQFYIAVKKEEMKVDCLSDLLRAVTFNQGIIFCDKRHQVDKLREQLQSRNITASAVVSSSF